MWQYLEYSETQTQCWITGAEPGSEVDAYRIGGNLPRELDLDEPGHFGWGGPNDFILDRRDFWASIGREGGGVLELFSDKHPTLVEGYFESFAEAVDLVFYADRTDLHKARSFYVDAVNAGDTGAVTPYVLLGAFFER